MFGLAMWRYSWVGAACRVVCGGHLLHANPPIARHFAKRPYQLSGGPVIKRGKR